MFLQMGFMRRFDAGYASAKKQIEEGRIGMPLVFKSTSRDPFRPSLEYANPKSSGGMLLDMGIHDFDLARWFMGDVRTVSTIGATIAYPELATVGDIDNAVASLTFASGKLGVVDLSRSGIYGYDISTEILGLEGTLKIGYLRETPVMLLTKNSVAHDTVPYFMERFRDAYTTQLQNFAQNVQQERPAPITIEDGMEALRIGVAATARMRPAVRSWCRRSRPEITIGRNRRDRKVTTASSSRTSRLARPAVVGTAFRPAVERVPHDVPGYLRRDPVEARHSFRVPRWSSRGRALHLRAEQRRRRAAPRLSAQGRQPIW